MTSLIHLTKIDEGGIGGIITYFSRRPIIENTINRTQDAGHALLRQTRNPKVRKKSGVI